MVRQESDREDLLREATALVERIELRIAAPPTDASTEAAELTAALPADSIVAGFRSSGAASFFFGAEPVYQFNPVGKLRRAYCEGRLIKAEAGRLIALERVRREREVCLVRHKMTGDEERAFLAEMDLRLGEFAAALERGKVEVVGQVPAEVDVLGRVREWLAQRTATSIAATPRAAGP